MLQGIIVEIRSKVFILTEIRFVSTEKIYLCTAVLISPYPGLEGNKLGIMFRNARDFNKIERRAVINPLPPTPTMQGVDGNSRHSDRNISLFPSWSG